jgi:hypothetical protein
VLLQSVQLETGMEHLSLAANGLQYESGVHAQAVFLQHPRLQRVDLRYNKSTKLGLLKVWPSQQMHQISFRRLGWAPHGRLQGCVWCQV